MPRPRHLWSGTWRRESESSRPEDTVPRREDGSEDPTAVHSAPPPTGPRPADDRRRSGFPGSIVAAMVATFLLSILGAFLVVEIKDDDSSDTSSSVAALPAAKGSAATKPAAPGTTEAIYKAAGPAVASIRTGEGSGTGFLVSNKNTIVTNAHVVDTSSTVKVSFGTTGKVLNGQVRGTDPSSDLAVVHIDGGAPADAKPLALADSRDLEVGQSVVAIGNPFGLDRTVTQGIVSALGREIQAPNDFAIENAIQTDAAINPGNSGGPLLDTKGRVVGVNSQIETGSQSGSGQGGNVGIGFAVPSNSVRTIAPQLAAGKKVEHAYLGVSTNQGLSGSGASVASVVQNGPADRAGVRQGDTITKIDGKTITQFSDIASTVDAHKPGDKIEVQTTDGTRDVTLGVRPASAQSSQSLQPQGQGQQSPQSPLFP